MVRHAALTLLAAAAGADAQQVQMPALLPTETLLQIEAHGTIKAVPDTAVLTTGVASGGTSAEAARAANAVVATRLIAAVRSAGVPDDAMRTEALTVGPRYRKDKDGDDTDVVIGYRAETLLTIRLTDVRMVSATFDAVSSAGATDIAGPAFRFSNDSVPKARARAAAIAAAQAQALDYAKPFGLHVARVLRISERFITTDGSGDIVVTARRKVEGSPSVLPGERDVTADVWVDYALTR